MFDIGASESHHHSYRWGLLEHTLDTIQKGLKSLNEKPIKTLDQDGYALETSSKRDAPLNQMTVFAACLLHDVGKVNTLEVWTQENEKKKNTWNPSTHGLQNYLQNLNTEEYKYTWIENRGGGHEKFNALHVNNILADDFLAALGKQKTELLIDAISPNKSHDNPIARYMTDADMLSVQEYMNSISSSSSQLNTDNNAPQTKETSSETVAQEQRDTLEPEKPEPAQRNETIAQEQRKKDAFEPAHRGETKQEPPKKPQLLTSKESVEPPVVQQTNTDTRAESSPKTGTEAKWISQFFDLLRTQVKEGKLSFLEDSEEKQSLVKKIVLTKRAIALNVNDYRNILLECGFNTSNAESVKKANSDLLKSGVAAKRESDGNLIFNLTIKKNKKVRAKVILLHPRCKLRFIPKGTPSAKNIELDYDNMIFAQAPNETQSIAEHQRPSPLMPDTTDTITDSLPSKNNKAGDATDMRSALILATGAWNELDKNKVHTTAEIVAHIKTAAGKQVDSKNVYDKLVTLNAISPSVEGNRVSFAKMKEIHRKLKALPE